MLGQLPSVQDFVQQFVQQAAAQLRPSSWAKEYMQALQRVGRQGVALRARQAPYEIRACNADDQMNTSTCPHMAAGAWAVIQTAPSRTSICDYVFPKEYFDWCKQYLYRAQRLKPIDGSVVDQVIWTIDLMAHVVEAVQALNIPGWVPANPGEGGGESALPGFQTQLDALWSSQRRSGKRRGLLGRAGAMRFSLTGSYAPNALFVETAPNYQGHVGEIAMLRSFMPWMRGGDTLYQIDFQEGNRYIARAIRQLNLLLIGTHYAQGFSHVEQRVDPKAAFYEIVREALRTGREPAFVPSLQLQAFGTEPRSDLYSGLFQYGAGDIESTREQLSNWLAPNFAAFFQWGVDAWVDALFEHDYEPTVSKHVHQMMHRIARGAEQGPPYWVSVPDWKRASGGDEDRVERALVGHFAGRLRSALSMADPKTFALNWVGTAVDKITSIVEWGGFWDPQDSWISSFSRDYRAIPPIFSRTFPQTAYDLSTMHGATGPMFDRVAEALARYEKTAELDFRWYWPPEGQKIWGPGDTARLARAREDQLAMAVYQKAAEGDEEAAAAIRQSLERDTIARQKFEQGLQRRLKTDPEFRREFEAGLRRQQPFRVIATDDTDTGVDPKTIIAAAAGAAAVGWIILRRR